MRICVRSNLTPLAPFTRFPNREWEFETAPYCVVFEKSFALGREIKPKEENKTKQQPSKVTQRSNPRARKNVKRSTSASALFQPLEGVRFLLVF